MESIMATPIYISEMILGKLIPYFVLGVTSATLCIILAITLFGVPFRGSFLILLVAISIFLICALSLGLLISMFTRSQLVSNQIAIMLAFMPLLFYLGFYLKLIPCLLLSE